MVWQAVQSCVLCSTHLSRCMVSMALMLRLPLVPGFFHCCSNWLDQLNRMPCFPSTHSTVVKRFQASLLQAPIALVMKAHSSLIFYRAQSVGITPTSGTVEPLVDNGHGWDDCFVYCWEIVLSSAIEYHNINCSLGSHKMKGSAHTTYAVPATALQILLMLARYIPCTPSALDNVV